MEFIKNNWYNCLHDCIIKKECVFSRGRIYKCVESNVLKGNNDEPINLNDFDINWDCYFSLAVIPTDNVNHPKELWKVIDEFPNYEVSNIARVRNKITGLIKVPSVGKRGYPVLSFKKEGQSYVRTLHRIFAIAWIPNPENKREINHINGDKCDCSFENLEWATSFENMEHARRTGLHNSDGDKAVWQLKDGEVVAVYKSCSEAARITGFNRGNISSCARGNTRLKTYKGYEWKYKIN